MKRAGRLAIDACRGRLHPLDAARDVLGPQAAGRPRRAPRYDPRAPRLLLSPHLDDAVLSCWRDLIAPGDLIVANVFSGRPPDEACSLYDRIAGATTGAVRMTERAEEDRAALALASRAPTNLGFLESDYRRRAPAVDAILAALVVHTPAASAVLAPAAIGLHPDHLLVRRAGVRLGRTGIPLTLYADLPYCVTYGWPAWVTGRPREPRLDVDAHWAQALAPLAAEGLVLERERVALEPAERTAKLAAMRRYETQYPTLTRGPLDVLAHPDVLGFEVRWRVAPWSSDEPSLD